MRRHRVLATGAAISLLGTTMASVAAPHVGAAGESVLFVTGNAADLPTADARIVETIERSGIIVDLVDDQVVTASDAGPADAVVISSSVVPSHLGRTFRNTPTPVVVLEPFQFNELAMTRSGGSNRGEVSGKRSLDIARPDHPLAAGLSGRVDVTTANAGMSWGRVVEDGIAVATVPGAGARASVFVYEAGAQMHQLVAPATRIGLFPSFATGNVLTPEGESLIVAALHHAVGSTPTGPGNEPPSVEAGDDQLIVTDSPTADVDTVVSGTVSDDGLPTDPGVVSVEWTGPAGVVFADPTATSTDVTLPGADTYALVLEATDGEYVVSDVVFVTVDEAGAEPVNQAPVADAGPDVTVSEGDAVTVTGTATDDGLPAPPGSLTYAWSGPPGVTFGSATSASTSVTVDGPGSYSLTFDADDGELADSDSMTLTVEATGPATALDVMYVAVNASGASAEQVVIQRLSDAGHDVTVVDDGAADPADAASFDLIVVSASISPGTFDAPWATAATPMVVFESKVYDDLGMTRNNSAGGFAGGQRDVRILDSTHPITSGLDGLVRVTAIGRNIAWGKPGGDVRGLASLKSTKTKLAIFTYEPGDRMDSGTAPARRVGLFLATNGGQVMTDDGWTLFDRAIAWAAATPSPAPVAVATADVTTGAAPQGVVFDASGSTGSIVSYDWDFADGATGSGIQDAHTYAEGGTYDVVLTVTDDEGRFATDTIRLVFDDPAPGGGRTGPIALYDFVQGARPDRVADVSGIGTALDLQIADVANVTWLPGGGLAIDADTQLESGPAEKINAAVKATEEITIEAWIDPVDDQQSGPARIVALTDGDAEDRDINAMLAQGFKTAEGDRVEARFLTSDTTRHGQPGVLSRRAAITGDLVHLVFTRSYTGRERLYVDGSLSAEWYVSGDAGDWNPATPLVLANERSGDRPWHGVLHRVQIFDRALPADEVCTNLALGPGRAMPGNDAPYPCLRTDSVGGVAPHTVRFDSRDAVDLDGSIASRRWTFGDGASSTATAPSHQYTDPGTYDVTLSVTDDDGASRTATFTIEIDDPTPPSAPTLREASGMRVGNGFFTQSDHEAREAWLGRELNWTAQFTSHHSASEMGSSAFGLFSSNNAELPNVNDRMNVAVAVGPAFGFKDLKNGGAAAVREQLLETLRGEHDFLYYRAATRVVDGGYEDAVIRIGHEFNAKWPPWASAGNEDLFIAAYRHVVRMFRNVSPDFRFDFSAFKQRFDSVVPQSYPGDDYVDIVSISLYWKNANGGNPWKEDKWADEYQQNLEDMLAFAIDHGKPIGIAEWGIQNLDEPRFIQRVYDFLVSVPASGPGHLAYNVYWDSGAATSRLDSLPAVKARYKQLFG